jgi:peptidyl-prolyl cis-trans isomerase SDCCAG10
MSSHYALEPQPTAKLLFQTSSGPITFELFAQQTPLACRNFLQHCIDGYYDSTIFHRIVPGFLVQGGDPTGTGEGGESIYEDDNDVDFKDEIHSRLRFNRRGLVGMAKSEDSHGNASYGSQFFITLAAADHELNGKCTLFGRVASGGDSIFNVVRIAESELVGGTERPVWPTKIESVEVLVNPFEGMVPRKKEAPRTSKEVDVKKTGKKKKKTTGKALLSFGDDETEDGLDAAPVHKRAKFNTSLVSGGDEEGERIDNAEKEKSSKTGGAPARSNKNASPELVPQKHTSVNRHFSSSTSPHASPKQPKQASPESQLPLRDPEIPSRSPSSSPDPTVSKVSSLLSRTNAQIAELKASMRRNVNSTPAEPGKKKKSALEQLIPETSIRGRKRRHGNDNASLADTDSMKILNAFKSRLENADLKDSKLVDLPVKHNGDAKNVSNGKAPPEEEDEEAKLCDLHFIANCQSCQAWDGDVLANADEEEDDGKDWMSHVLSFEKDRLGKDLTWRRKNEEELVVIDPREKGREIKEAKKKSGRSRA